MSGMISIVWLTDEHECGTCGYSVAKGAAVYEMHHAKWRLLFALTPVARCGVSDTWDQAAVYREILTTMGHEIIDG